MQNQKQEKGKGVEEWSSRKQRRRLVGERDRCSEEKGFFLFGCGVRISADVLKPGNWMTRLGMIILFKKQKFETLIMGCVATKSADAKANRLSRWTTTGIVALRDAKLKAI
ncbi:hypothetical protein OSB04_005223 [Centaurea solstitialis]|uniref:Uncharacterized protein n=1 Tax=Centaurea solstitialis TaxID=347529 RepID=A0AA38U093_9ASTR|nr:hypothetical protein OSB04_005223 [Centaurea solstitialis]